MNKYAPPEFSELAMILSRKKALMLTEWANGDKLYRSWYSSKVTEKSYIWFTNLILQTFSVIRRAQIWSGLFLYVMHF